MRLSALSILSFASAPAAAQNVLYSWTGDENGDVLGWSVANAGDVDGDGVADIVAGMLGAGASSRGEARVFSGADGAGLWCLTGDAQSIAFGYSVAGAGDVNADGFADVMVGDRGADAAWVYSGADGSVLYHKQASVSNELGYSVAGVGDVDLDGHDDFIVGAPEDGTLYPGGGRALLYSGFNGSILHVFDADHSSNHLGRSVAGAGDVNGDGRPDILIGSPDVSTVASGNGRVELYSGLDYQVLRVYEGDSHYESLGSAVASAGDVDADGYMDLLAAAKKDDLGGPAAGSVFVWSGRGGALLYTKIGTHPDMQLGWSVSGAGDVDGDGHDDFLIGTPFSDLVGEDFGTIWLYSGADGSLLEQIEGDHVMQRFGYALAGGVDLDGDQLAEFVVGAPWDDSVGSARGLVRVYAQQCPGEPTPYCVAAPNSAGAGAQLGHAGSRNIAAGDFVLTASGCPASQFGFFFYGPGQQQAPVGNGFLCVHQGTIGLFRLIPPVQTDAQGTALRPIDFTQPPMNAGAGQILPGVGWNFQFMYRDALARGAAFNFTNALNVVFCP